jgi:hypothetical protein
MARPRPDFRFATYRGRNFKGMNPAARSSVLRLGEASRLGNQVGRQQVGNSTDLALP